MLLARRTLTFVTLAAGLAGCSDSTGPFLPHAAVTVQSPSLSATTVPVGATTWIKFDVPVRIENTGSTTVAYGYCADRVEARSGDTWTVAWTPVCTMMAGSFTPVEIPAGESREFIETVQAVVSGPGGPAWTAGAGASEYRFVITLATPGTTGRSREVASNSFTVTVGH